MNTSVLCASLKEWFNNLPKDHSMPVKRPIVLIPKTSILYDEEAERYYFMNPKGHKQFGLVVFINDHQYLLWFLPLRLTLQEIEYLVQSNYSFEVKIITTQRYQEISNEYSQGVSQLNEPLEESL